MNWAYVRQVGPHAKDKETWNSQQDRKPLYESFCRPGSSRNHGSGEFITQLHATSVATPDTGTRIIDSFKPARSLLWEDIQLPSMKLRNEIGLLFVLQDLLELKGKSGNGQHPSRITLCENTTITHSLAISAPSESTSPKPVRKHGLASACWQLMRCAIMQTYLDDDDQHRPEQHGRTGLERLLERVQ